ncbi:MAG: IMPACT family protein [Bacteroidales bacterium]
MMDDIYYTIEGESKGMYKEKGSKFISLGYSIKSSEQAKEIINNVKKEYYDARHHCYAYILGFDKKEFRMNDDGEPSYSAGKPIYGQLVSKDLTNILVVVIRYFGGVKLGVGGLTNAYKQATIDLLENSVIVTKTIMNRYSISFDYSSMNDVMRILKEYSLIQENHNFDLECYLEFCVRKNEQKKIVEKFRDLEKVEIKFIEEF